MKLKSLMMAGLVAMIASCDNNRKLPILGERYAEEKEVNGKTVVDTVYQHLPQFTFTNQDGISISNSDLEGKIVVADFFFITCPTICPVMKREMLRVYEKYKSNNEVLILSHTIDPDHDTL